VAIFLPLRSFHELLSEVAALCEHHGTVLRLDSDIFDLKKAPLRVRDFDGGFQVATHAGVFQGWPGVIKRVLDVLGSSVLLVLLSPFLLLAALLIKLTSKGPILFLQERVGFNKRRFKIYKFRTMVPGAEKMITQLQDLNEAGGPVFKIKSDPRITPVGKLLRRTSIDELPQIFNVLKGDMSLVGPRPLPVRDYEGFNEDWQRRRFSARPGITCLWQVSGRSSIPFEQWMRLDMQYLDEWSLWLDVKILVRTIPAVLKGSGAV
jgi:exopolysaccharide biosynthesis polyprenyl glycosylphosphotransferase